MENEKKKNKIKEIFIKILNIFSYIFSGLFIITLVFAVVQCSNHDGENQDPIVKNHINKALDYEDIDTYMTYDLDYISSLTRYSWLNGFQYLDGQDYPIDDGFFHDFNVLTFDENYNEITFNYCWFDGHKFVDNLDGEVVYYLDFNFSYDGATRITNHYELSFTYNPTSEDDSYFKVFLFDWENSLEIFRLVVQNGTLTTAHTYNVPIFTNFSKEQLFDILYDFTIDTRICNFITRFFKTITTYDLINLSYNWYPFAIASPIILNPSTGIMNYGLNSGESVGQMVNRLWNDDTYSRGFNGLFYCNGDYYTRIKVYYWSVGSLHLYKGTGDKLDPNNYEQSNYDDGYVTPAAIYFYKNSGAPRIVASIETYDNLSITQGVSFSGVVLNSFIWSSEEFRNLKVIYYDSNWIQANGFIDGGKKFLTSTYTNVYHGVSFGGGSSVDNFLRLATSSLNNMTSLLSINLIGGISLGTLIFAPLVSGIIVLVLRSVKK